MLLKPHYFVHLEVPKTLREVVAGAPPLITNCLAPTVSIGAVAKRAIPAGTPIETALGGFELRGEAVEIDGNEDAVPITVLDGARTRVAIEPGAVDHRGRRRRARHAGAPALARDGGAPGRGKPEAPCPRC